MNLEESDSFRDELEKTSRKKKLIIVSIILCAILIALLLALIIAIQRQDATTEKFFVNGVQISKPENVYLDVEGVTYVNVKAFKELLEKSSNTTLKYDYQGGHYGVFDEDEESCYIDNGYEAVAMSTGNKYYQKYINKETPEESVISGIEVSIKSEYGYSEKFNIENPIIYVNNEIYVPLENIPEMFNLRLEWGQYRKRIYTFEAIIDSAKTELGKLGTGQIMSGYYENLKALVYGYAVLQDANEENYGVFSLADGSNRLSSKYKDITFVQNVQEFYITADNGTMGLVSADGRNIIKASEYNNISLLDDDSQLYMVEKDKEYGVISRAGRPIIHAEYDKIGIDISKFNLDAIENEKLLLEKCIPVEKNKKYGLYNIDGEQILNESYDGLGYISQVAKPKAGEEESILLIPKTEGVNGIIVNQGDLYGIFDVDDESLFLPCSFTKIYAIRKGGNIIYYIEYNGQQYELKSYLEGLGIAKRFDLLEEDENSESSEETEDGEEIEKTEETEENSNTVNSNTVENEKTIEVEL